MQINLFKDMELNPIYLKEARLVFAWVGSLPKAGRPGLAIKTQLLISRHLDVIIIRAFAMVMVGLQ